jgi:hypothetical protein
LENPVAVEQVPRLFARKQRCQFPCRQFMVIQHGNPCGPPSRVVGFMTGFSSPGGRALVAVAGVGLASVQRKKQAPLSAGACLASLQLFGMRIFWPGKIRLASLMTSRLASKIFG